MRRKGRNITFVDMLVGHIDVWMSVLLQSVEAAGLLPVSLPGPAVPSQTIASRFSVATAQRHTRTRGAPRPVRIQCTAHR